MCGRQTGHKMWWRCCAHKRKPSGHRNVVRPSLNQSTGPLAIARLLSDRLEVGELLDGALLEEELLVEHATEADHGEAAVLHLDEAAAGERIRVLAEAAHDKMFSKKLRFDIVASGKASQQRTRYCSHHLQQWPAAAGCYPKMSQNHPQTRKQGNTSPRSLHPRETHKAPGKLGKCTHPSGSKPKSPASRPSENMSPAQRATRSEDANLVTSPLAASASPAKGKSTAWQVG